MNNYNKKIILYITAGFPNINFTIELIKLLQDYGCYAIELGVPYSDPVADGPIISLTSLKSLQKGTNLDLIFDKINTIKDEIKIPLYIMSYYSPIYTYGEKKFINKCIESNIKGCIIPDLPIEEGKIFYNLLKENKLDPILLAFPNTDDNRINEISYLTGSFIYYVNLFGTTGIRSDIPDDSINHLKHTKEISNKPIFAGFGVSNKNMCDKLLKYADGVIIGSAIMKIILENENNENIIKEKIKEFISNILS